MRIQSVMTFAALVLALPFAANAEVGKPRTKMTREEMQKRDAELFRDFQRQQEDQKRFANKQIDPWTQRSRVTVKAHEEEMRIEKYVDGTILYSMEIDKKFEAVLYQGNLFRKVEKKEEINDRVVFEGRVYRVMRTRGDAEQWKSMVGREVFVTMQTEGGSQVALSVRVKR